MIDGHAVKIRIYSTIVDGKLLGLRSNFPYVAKKLKRIIHYTIS